MFKEMTEGQDNENFLRQLYTKIKTINDAKITYDHYPDSEGEIYAFHKSSSPLFGILRRLTRNEIRKNPRLQTELQVPDLQKVKISRPQTKLPIGNMVNDFKKIKKRGDSVSDYIKNEIIQKGNATSEVDALMSFIILNNGSNILNKKEKELKKMFKKMTDRRDGNIFLQILNNTMKENSDNFRQYSLFHRLNTLKNNEIKRREISKNPTLNQFLM
ncbi:MAG: hypothetical protein Ta2D_12380 [Rickettsiales bacterium]|nr:MAG: hypothetical protein Ta2D_12380 [Rickettsiales bacterium]